MNEPSCPWPRQFERWRMDDSATQAAYDTTGPTLRQSLKNGIAAAYWHFGREAGILSGARRDAARGFSSGSLDCPADWTLLLVGPEFDAPARLAAAAILPRLAGVELVGALFSDALPDHGLLLGLALSGCEDVFLMPAGALAHGLPSIPGRGVVFFLHEGSLAGSASNARADGLACLDESRKPRLGVAEPELVDRQSLIFCQGEAGRLALDSPVDLSDCDAIYGVGNSCLPDSRSPRLAMSPGLEGFWLHESAGPENFRMRRLTIARLEADSVFPDFA